MSKQDHEKRAHVCGINKPLKEQHKGTIATRSDFKTIGGDTAFISVINYSTLKFIEPDIFLSQGFKSKIFRPPEIV